MVIDLKSRDPHSDQFFSGYRSISWQVGIRSHAWSPPTDVYESDTAFIVRVEIAGMQMEDFQIRADRNILVVSGQRCDECERRTFRRMEIRYGEFSTAVELPARVKPEDVKAEYCDGFLTIFLPKKRTG